MYQTREWSGYWISGGTDPAPYLRKSFILDKCPEKAECFLCGLGWHELYVNGIKADDRVLAPVVSQFDKHVSYIRYDVAQFLKTGENVIAVLLGNGLYNCRTMSNWNFPNAPWLDKPKMLCDLLCDGNITLISDDSWKIIPSPILLNQLRNGEEYDATKEIDGMLLPGFDDSAYANASYCNPPGGEIAEETATPCRIGEILTASCNEQVPGIYIYDFSVNLTGWCEITVEGPKGSIVEMDYAEKIFDNGSISQDPINECVHSGRFQHDRYYLKGTGKEIWHPRFTYHGFRYCQVSCWEGAKVIDAKAHFVHSDFRRIGHFECSNDLVNKLYQCTMQSYLSNYTGIPTDCPHREKNGWTGDAQLALELGLWNFDAAKSISNFARILADTQRPSGQLPGIAPTAGWGYNWGNGPLFDIYLFEAPYRVALFTGDDSLFLELLPAMEKYLEYCRGMSHGYLVNFGLGDWNCYDRYNMTPIEMTSSAYYFHAVKLVSKYKPEYACLAEKIGNAINRKYYRGNGIYADGQRTALAAALYFGFAEEPEKTAKALAEAVRNKKYLGGFGIMGSKCIFRALADYGYAEDAFKLLTAVERPSFGYWVKALGATTLHERWASDTSLNHVMFGDFSAWLHQYLAGIVPIPDVPGFRHFKLKPCFVPELDFVKADHETAYGAIIVHWKRNNGTIRFSCTIPEGCTADIELPGRIFEKQTGCVECDIPCSISLTN